MSWDLTELTKNIQKLYGTEQSKKLEPCLNSIEERKTISQYHYCEAKDSVENILYRKPDADSLIDLILIDNSKEGEELEEYKFIIKANILSCIQNIHCISDTLSHVIYYSLNLKNPKDESRISLNNVLKSLKSNKSNKKITDLIDSLISNKDYIYLSAIVNHSKHKSIIDNNFKINFREKDKKILEIKLQEFIYRQVTYPSCNAFEFLTKEFDRESDLVIKIGNKLNSIVLNELLKLENNK